jgi:hypothetical protein
MPICTRHAACLNAFSLKAFNNILIIQYILPALLNFEEQRSVFNRGPPIFL